MFTNCLEEKAPTATSLKRGIKRSFFRHRFRDQCHVPLMRKVARLHAHHRDYRRWIAGSHLTKNGLGSTHGGRLVQLQHTAEERETRAAAWSAARKNGRIGVVHDKSPSKLKTRVSANNHAAYL
jgi:hypothetical protein